jgi:hypothetical protein
VGSGDKGAREEEKARSGVRTVEKGAKRMNDDDTTPFSLVPRRIE